MTHYYKGKLNIEMADNEQFDPVDVLKTRVLADMDSATAGRLDVIVKYDFDDLDNTGQLIDEDAFKAAPAIVIIDNTKSICDIQFDGWSDDGTVNPIGWNIRAGHLVKFSFHIGEGVTKISSASASCAAMVRMWIMGENP